MYLMAKLDFLSPFSTISVLNNQNSEFFLKILIFPNYLSLRESTDIKSAQKFQLKPGQNPIGKCVETGVYLIILGF